MAGTGGCGTVAGGIAIKVEVLKLSVLAAVLMASLTWAGNWPIEFILIGDRGFSMSLKSNSVISCSYPKASKADKEVGKL